MAKRTTKRTVAKRTVAKRTSAKKPTGLSQEIADLIAAKRKALASKIDTLPDDLLFEFGSARIGGPLQHGGHFSDWHDSFSNEGTWTKTWGKAGGDSVRNPGEVRDVRPSEMINAISTVRTGTKGG
ncbi:MAG: hypothetical protein HUJ11_03470 [Arenibacter algicola]|nr:hypothetical protein [Arenibacter algicola]